jgi:glycosyltransferase involved in cell wall biosynthesis
MKTALVMPLYEPSPKTLPFLKSIEPGAFSFVLVIDDGSGEKYAPVFADIKKMLGFEVLAYPHNGGKGHALKAAFAYIGSSHPEIEGIVTADGDGQHAYSDIKKVRDALAAAPDSLVLGVRDFRGPDVPKHNRAGNRFSRAYFFLARGVKVRDTQTGLRGIPKSLFSLALETKGERYEYEMNFLLAAVREAPLAQVNIQTIYDDNASSHFRPFRDSIRIYRTPLLYVTISLVSVLIDLGLFSLFSLSFTYSAFAHVFFPTVLARLVSGSFNFVFNNGLVFPSDGRFWRHLARYSVIFAINMCLSFTFVFLFSESSWALILIKVVVDAAIFVLNYFVQLSWVFASKKARVKKTQA